MSYVRTPALETVRMNPHTGSIPGMTRAQAVRPLPGTAVLASRGALGTFNLDGSIDGRCNPHSVFSKPSWDELGTCLTTPEGEPVCKDALAYWGTQCPSKMTQVNSGYVTIDYLLDGTEQRDFSCCTFKPSLPPPAPKPAPTPTPTPTPTPKPATPPPPPPEPSAAPYAIGGLAALALIAGGIYWVTR